MQIKKEEVKKRIYDAALSEFKKNGYKGTTIRGISKIANVPIGNLYRYYKNKGLIFEDIVDEVYTKLMNCIGETDDIGTSLADMELNIHECLGKLIDIHTDYRDELLILFTGSKGSKYENFKQLVINCLSDRIKCECQFYVDKGEALPRDLFIIDVIATGVIEGFIMISKKYDDTDELECVLKEYAQLNFDDFSSRLKLITNNKKK